MILEYGVKNYFSFKEWSSVSFRLSQQCPKSISYGEEFTRVLGVKGANASGKTNILKALNFLSQFCCNSFSYKPDEQIRTQSFFENTDITELYVEFKCNNIYYRYEIALTEEKVHRETIFRTKKRETKLIERIDNELTVCNREFNRLKIVNFRNNASLISTAHQYEISELDEIYSFFSNIFTNVHMFGLDDNNLSVSMVSEFFEKNDSYFEFVKKIIMKYDPDIKDIKILKHETDDVTKYHPMFYYNVSGKSELLTFYEQSSGTKSLYLQLSKYKLALNTGSLLVLDEFDINLHPEILPDLLSLFMSKKINAKNAQLIFTTHNTSILDYLGKYRACLVNKENCESYIYRLDEIPGDMLRNDRDITPIYRSGKIGGVPKF